MLDPVLATMILLVSLIFIIGLGAIGIGLTMIWDKLTQRRKRLPAPQHQVGRPWYSHYKGGK